MQLATKSEKTRESNFCRSIRTELLLFFWTSSCISSQWVSERLLFSPFMIGKYFSNISMILSSSFTTSLVSRTFLSRLFIKYFYYFKASPIFSYCSKILFIVRVLYLLSKMLHFSYFYHI